MTYLEDHPRFREHLSGPEVAFPLAINMELTTRCNLRCIMCPKTAGQPRTPPNRRMDPEVFERILTEVVPRVARVDLVGDGEVLLEKERLQRLLAEAGRLGVLVNASSNGVLLDDEAVAILVEGRMADLNVSLDAATPETFQALRGASFEQVLEGIERLRQAKEAAGTDRPRLHLSMVGMERNIRELPDLVRLAAELGAMDVTLQAMGEFEEVRDQSVYLRNPELGREMLAEARRVGAEVGVEVLLWPDSQFEHSGTEPEDPTEAAGESPAEPILRKDCDFPWDVPYFTTDGKVLPCCAHPPLGDLREDSFDGIWNGKMYQGLRRAIYSDSPPLACRNCPGRGWFEPTIPGPELVMGGSDRQRGRGFYELEQDPQGRAYRWTGPLAAAFVVGEDQPVVELTVARDPNPQACGQVLVRVDQEPPQALALEGADWDRVLLARGSGRDLTEVELRCDETWMPARIIPDAEDRRPLGIKVASVRLIGRSSLVRFGGGIRLLGHDWIGEPLRPGAPAALELYWQADLRRGEPPAAFVHVYRERPPRILPGQIRRLWGRFGLPVASFQLDHHPPFRTEGGRPVIPSLGEAVLPRGLQPGTYRVGIGLWWPGGERVPIQESSLETEGRLAVIGRVEVQAG